MRATRPAGIPDGEAVIVGDVITFLCNIRKIYWNWQIFFWKNAENGILKEKKLVFGGYAVHGA